jgi:Fe-S-cluster-containing hydrogenase component 2
MSYILRDKNACYGCRSCELACSFHHRTAFSPEASSIKVTRNNRTGRINWSVDSSCDRCNGENSPLCVRYCAYDALHSENSI